MENDAAYNLSKQEYDQSYLNQLSGYLPEYFDNMTSQIADQTAQSGITTQAMQSALDSYNAYSDVEAAQIESLNNINPEDYADRAAADAAQAFSNAEAANRRSMSRMGVNPNSGRFADQSRLNATDKALAISSAKTQGRIQGEETAFNRRQSALNTRSSVPTYTSSTSLVSPVSATSGSSITSTDISSSSASSYLSSAASTNSGSTELIKAI